jgi:hypothetical protein
MWENLWLIVLGVIIMIFFIKYCIFLYKKRKEGVVIEIIPPFTFVEVIDTENETIESNDLIEIPIASNV